MEPEAQSDVCRPWLSELCAQLKGCQTIKDVEDLLYGLDASLLSDSQNESLLNQLSSTSHYPQLQALVLTCGSWFQQLSYWLLKSFPTFPEEFCSSVHSETLRTLSHFIHFIQFPFDRETQQSLAKAQIRVELIPQVLNAFTSLSFDQPDAVSGLFDLYDTEFDGVTIGRKTKQSHYKAARRAKKKGTALQPRDLNRLGISKPQSAEEAIETTHTLLNELKAILEDYLRVLQRRDIVPFVQRMFIGEAPTDGRKDAVQKSSNPDTVAVPEATTSQLPSAYPLVQPMKAALYFESASGFGEWRILISTRADRDLRAAKRRDAKFFKIAIKKIVELSNGHFSRDNHKRLNKSDETFPVYEAKMTNDTRLVYQIDCIPDYIDNVQFLRQVIKIFGIYTHAQIDNRFWDSVGYQLARTGKAYRERCSVRILPESKGDNVILPATFPKQANENVETLIVPELPKEDLEEIHSLLALEKYMTLSKELLKSIFADLDVAHVFNVTLQEQEIIDHEYSCYVLGRSGTGKTTTMLFKMLRFERAYTQQVETSVVLKPRQIFVTQSRVLATRVEEYFAKLMESLSVAQRSKEELKLIAEQKRLQHDENNTMYDVDDDVTWKEGLPQKFSLLQDEHFPLFLTFERLCQMLESDIENVQSEMNTEFLSENRLVTYDVFLKDYWPHFPQDLTKNLDPALVFSEFLGVIEGSEQSLAHAARFLDEASYGDLSYRTQHVFAKQRGRVYSLFQAYVKRKRSRGDWDSADRTHRILQAFETSGVPGAKIHYLYVDEAQDNLLIDAKLLRSLCINPNGLFWAGDTAQTIAIGSSFRFNDLKAFLYRLEQRREQKLNDGNVIAQSELRTFQLAVNYRSHGGIVRCATAVIELITQFWPHAIDALAPEQGLVDGAKPVFFSGWDTDTVRYEQFLFGDSGERIEFGARQCILVRDETARTELREQVGDIGLILTLYESKGLEFDDVLLYKFFEDSTADLNQWRVVLNLMQTSKGEEIRVPRFDEDRHAGICSELKFLYVAITRSRKNLWIVDCSHKAEPMRMLWGSKGLIQDCKPGEDVPRLAVSSSPDEWAATGRTLFTNRRYLQAMHAFERAGLPRQVKIAQTHHLRDSARRVQHSNAERRKAFCAAGTSFLECAHNAKGKEQQVFFHNAGDCFENAAGCGENADDYGKAARAYEAAMEYNRAVRLYRKSDMFDEAVKVVRKNGEKMDRELADGVLEIAKLFYFRGKEFGKATQLFDSIGEQLEYLENNILLDDCHATVLAELGRYQEAADIHISAGRTRDAIQVLLEDKDNPSSIQRGNNCILEGLWQNTSFSHKIRDTDTAAIGFLKYASKVDTSILSPSQRDQVIMFQSLRTSVHSPPFRQLAYDFLTRNESHEAFLCFDHYFINFPRTVAITNTDLAVILTDFLTYCQLFRRMVQTLDLADEATQKLFGFYPASITSTYYLRAGTWLFNLVTMPRAWPQVEILEINEETSTVIGRDLLQALRTHLWKRLEERIAQENDICVRLPVFVPCLHFVNRGICRRQGCLRPHITPQDLTQNWLSAQIRIHFLQILVYQVYHSIPSLKPNSVSERRHWIHRLCETLGPPAHFLGSQASLHWTSLPEAFPASEVVKHWSRDILGTREQPPDRMLVTFLYEAATLCHLFDPQNAGVYLSRAPLLGTFSKTRLFYRSSGAVEVYVLPELYHCLQAADDNFISAGILFLKHVIERRNHIDLNVLCQLVEFIAGSVILARVQFNLHLVTLPRGWLLFLLGRISVRRAGTQLLDLFLASIRLLLTDLVQGGASYMFFENRDVAEMPQSRELFIPRICRALGLVGYNINNVNLQDEIMDIFKVLSSTTTFRPLFRRYMNLRGWGGVCVAVEASCTDSLLEEMVQLYSKEKHDPQTSRPARPGLRRVLYRNLEDIPSILSAQSLKAGPPIYVAPELIPDSQSLTATVPEDETVEEHSGHAADQPEADVTDLIDSRGLVESLASTAVPVTGDDVVTPEQKAVAERLTSIFRQVLRNRRLEKNKTTSKKTWDSFFHACLKESEGMDWPHGFFYRKLYLGLVPHLLVCVNKVESYVYSMKGKARLRMLDPRVLDLDALNKRMNDLSTMSKASNRLRKLLEPSSQLHKRRDLEQLKQAVGEVGELVKGVPQAISLEIKYHLDMAYKGIVQESKPPKPKPKPDLQPDDETYETGHSTPI